MTGPARPGFGPLVGPGGPGGFGGPGDPGPRRAAADAAGQPRDLDRLGREAAEILADLGRPEVVRVTVGALVTRHAEKGIEVLLLRRLDSGDYAGIEELPGGQVEAGETLLAALRREVAEETGLVVGAVNGFAFEFDYPSRLGQTVQLTYAVSVVGDPEIRLDPTEHDGARWVPAADIGDTDLTGNVCERVRTYLAAARS